jgi:dihydropyrimidinase
VSFDALVAGGHVVLPEHAAPLRADVAIEGGTVAALLRPGAEASADRVWDASGRLVLPGAVDPHVHVAWPYLGSRTCDDYPTATRAAALGGTTTLVDFALEGRESPVRALARRRAQADGRAVVDYAFHVVVSEASERVLAEMADVVEEGVTSFKLYMTYRARGLAVDDHTLFAVSARAAELGAVVGVHAENADLDDARTAALRARGHGAARFLPLAKPPWVEAEAIARAGRIVAAAGGRLWILHLSSAEGLEAALATRARCGQPEALETCPQYLLLTRRELHRPDGHRFLCSPPLRAEGDRRRLWEAAEAGEVDWIGTDHCLFLAAQKDAHAEAFWACPHGLPGVQTRPMLVLAAAERAGWPLTRAAEVLAAGAARWLGLYPRKGTLLPGSDADLAVWDPSARVRIDHAELAMGADWSPYQGREAWAGPELVLVRGEAVVAPGGPEAGEGHGRFLARRSAPALTPQAVA